MVKYKTGGWFKQSVRHSNARKYGRAGGVYKKYLSELVDEKGRILRRGGFYYYKKGSSKPIKYEKKTKKKN